MLFYYLCRTITYFLDNAHIYIVLGLDGLFVSFLSCLSAHFRILQGAFRTVKQRCLKKMQENVDQEHEKVENLNDAINIEMKKCVQRLQILMR